MNPLDVHFLQNCLYREQALATSAAPRKISKQLVDSSVAIADSGGVGRNGTAEVPGEGDPGSVTSAGRQHQRQAPGSHLASDDAKVKVDDIGDIEFLPEEEVDRFKFRESHRSNGCVDPCPVLLVFVVPSRSGRALQSLRCNPHDARLLAGFPVGVHQQQTGLRGGLPVVRTSQERSCCIIWEDRDWR
jgi:hypothetical protein